MTEIPLVPQGGFPIEAFPQLIVVNNTYTSNAAARPDPLLTINSEDQLLVDVGNVRVGIPTRQEWRKLVWMVEALWNSHDLNNQQQQAIQEQQYKESNHADDAVNGSGTGNRRNTSHPH